MAGPRKQSGLKLLVDYLESVNLLAFSAMQVLFTLHEYNRPLTVKQIFGTGSGYRRAQLRYMAEIGLLKHEFSDAQRRGAGTDARPTAYGLAKKGRYHVESVLTRECPDIEDRAHLSRWLKLIKKEGVDSFSLLRLLVQVEEKPGQCGRELFTYRSGFNNEQVDRLTEQDLIVEELNNSRKEKYPGERWLMLRGYLNWPIPDSLINQSNG